MANTTTLAPVTVTPLVSGVSTTTVIKLRQIEAWPHWNEVIEIAVKEYSITEEEAHQALPEYQRFMCLLALGYRQLSMFSVPVDKIWHAQILHTGKYAHFCLDIVGRFIHHAPILGKNRDCTTPEDICSTKCDTGPDTDPIPAVGAPSSVIVIESELPAATRFRLAYIRTFGEEPGALWNLPVADGIAI